jgi:membrane protein
VDFEDRPLAPEAANFDTAGFAAASAGGPSDPDTRDPARAASARVPDERPFEAGSGPLQDDSASISTRRSPHTSGYAQGRRDEATRRRERESDSLGGAAVAESQLTSEQQAQTIWDLGGLTPGQLVRRVWREIDHDNVLGRASELAYNFLLAVFPLLLFVLAMLGVLAERGMDVRTLLFQYLGRVLPGSASELISKTANEVIKNSGGGKLTFGILFSLWSASGGTTTMMSTLNDAYDVRESRSWIRVHLIALGLTLVLVLLVVVGSVLAVAGGHIAWTVGNNIGLGTPVIIAWRVLSWIAAVAFIVFAFAVIYYYGPDVKQQHWYWITPGSVLGVGLWVIASAVFRLYLHFFNSYSRTYGSLGAVIILLLWLYVTGLAFLVGGEVNAEIEHAAAHRGHPEAKAEGEKQAA